MKLGRYEIVRELGKGAMGVVYLAKDPLIGRLVALKTIRVSGDEDDEAHEFQQRFVREAQAAGILNHPAIVTVHDIGQDPDTGTSFIAMEFVEGLNLKEAMTQGKGFSHTDFAELIAQIAEALDFAHAKGIVHRDVKPANIILVDDKHAKITDFGIAKIASGAQNLTTTGQFLGTPNYMAPEQIKGSHVDGRTDLFSLGIVFYETLTRRKPFAGDSLTTISYKIVHEPFPPLHTVDPTIPAQFEAIIKRALEKDPVKRYQRGLDMASDVRLAVQGKPISQPVNRGLDETSLSEAGPRTGAAQESPFPDDDAGGATVTGGQAARGMLDQSPQSMTPRPATPVDPTMRSRTTPPTQRPAQRPMSAPVVAKPGLFDVARGVLTRRIPAALFFVAIAAVIAPLILAVILIKQGEAGQPMNEPDPTREAQVEQQRVLRTEAATFLRANNVDAAYVKYRQLLQLAPKSPAIRKIVDGLDSIRNEQLGAQQRIAEADAKFEEGRLLYEQKKFEEALVLFEEAFHMNPNLEEAVNYLRMSREQMALQQSQTAPNQLSGGVVNQAGQTPRGAAQTAVSRAPAALTVTCASTVGDGYVLVKVNGETFVHENLWEEKTRFLVRRKSPRPLNVTKPVASNAVEIEVWVVIPSLKIQDKRQLSRNFAPGSEQSLVINIDEKTKKIDIQI